MALSVVGLSTVLLIENANTRAIALALSVLTHSFLVERSGLPSAQRTSGKMFIKEQVFSFSSTLMELIIEKITSS